VATVFATISQIKFGMKTYRVCKETNEIEARNAVVCLPSGENLLNRKSVHRVIERKLAVASQSLRTYVFGLSIFCNYKF
jgi:hypothetical protein